MLLPKRNNHHVITHHMSDRPRFLFVTCQVGAERAVKGEIARRWDAFRFAFSQPGFLTFKLPADLKLPADFYLGSVFARSYGLSLGKTEAGSNEELARRVWEIFARRRASRIHVWQRDATEPGDRGFEPSITAAAIEAGHLIRQLCPDPEMLADDPLGTTTPGEYVLDCVMVEPDQWWVGYHQAASVSSCWPGGIIPLDLPAEAVSRGWLKMEEALQWSQLPIGKGARCVELGSSPGGSSQALLARGAQVLGIDPAEMHAAVLSHANFTHIRRRVPQVRRREFRRIRWLTADMSVTPSYTLDAVEAIVSHPGVNIRGLLLTLKFTDWKLAEQVDEYMDRVRDWGFNLVSGRQLVHNRREICVSALKKPFRHKARTGRKQRLP